MSIKIFCDIADFNLIKKFNKKKLVKGFTTNPSLMRKAGAKDYKSYSEKILKVCRNKPISLEVFADNFKDSEIYDKNSKLNIERVSAFKFFKKYRKLSLINEFFKKKTVRGFFFDHL